MNEYFIQKLNIKAVRDIKDFEIPLDENERKHLIITGKNGCGKTSTLNEIDTLLNKLINNQFAEMSQIDDFSKVELIFSNQSEIYENIARGKFILAFFKAKRHNEPTIPQTPTKQAFQAKYQTTYELNKTFLQYLLNLKTEQAFAQIRKDDDTVNNIGLWFNNFEIRLRELFEKEDLKLQFDDKGFNFKIAYGNKSFGLNELSDGYSSLLAIVTELILRMEAQSNKAYDMQGVVLIDEIETHLHVELQKKVLPFLVSFFPKIQFIVTTHSPFVLSSLSNAVICDLEKRFITTDLSSCSYDALIESYFNSDKYSQDIKSKIAEFESLVIKDSLNDDEKSKYYELKNHLKSLPTFMSEELDVKIKQLLLMTIAKKGF